MIFMLNSKQKNNCSTQCCSIPVLAVLLFMASTAFAEQRVDILSLPDINDWDEESFSGETRYEVVTIDDKPVIKAISKSAASGMVRHIDVDLTKTPYMNWSWKVENILTNVDETQKSGDDYAARIYVVISGGFLFWKTRAISYAWASKKPKGAHWPNAFTENALMIASESGEEHVGEWINEKRNILDDIKNLLGIEATEINAVAIMTDTDNSKQSATAYYGNVFFTDQ